VHTISELNLSLPTNFVVHIGFSSLFLLTIYVIYRRMYLDRILVWWCIRSDPQLQKRLNKVMNVTKSNWFRKRTREPCLFGVCRIERIPLPPEGAVGQSLAVVSGGGDC
jgi:hypothetical protein